MIIKYSDYNAAEKVISKKYKEEWGKLEKVLFEMPLHLKISDQAGRVGSFIFNPVGTNRYIKKQLVKFKWLSNIPIPEKYSFLGINVDFGVGGIVIEVQFSNYPFFLNNLVRSELFYKSKTSIAKKPTDLLIIITKAHMFPASNSTLYYEQAVKQINELAANNVFDIPIRVIGLFVEKEKEILAKLTKYDKNRYSRTIVKELKISCSLKPLKSGEGRCLITKL